MVFPVVRSDLVKPALWSFLGTCDRSIHRIIVVDQTKDGLGNLVREGFCDMHIQAYRCLGFAKAANTGIRLADTEYVTICNDDVFFFDKRYWDGITSIFDRVENAVAVNPSCPRIPGWSLGKKDPEHIAGIDSAEKCKEEGVWDLLKEKTPFRGLVRGICMWCTTFSIPRLMERGLLGNRMQLFDEKFFPGSGEDYDVNARIFRDNGVAVGTHESWVWHDWGMSKDRHGHDGEGMISQRPTWNKIGDLWEAPFTVYGSSKRKTAEIFLDVL
jgi:GT2 family glycosyltransferase